jgi:long-chain acyl-CoA synthetase
MAAWLGVGTVMAFAESVERAVDNAAEIKATVLPAVPRVFEKAFSKVVADGSSARGLKGRLFQWAMRQFDVYVAAKIAGREITSIQWSLAKRLVFAKIEERLKARFGGRMRLFVSGGAPLSKKIAYFFDACGLLIVEGYGLTETCAGTFVNRPTNVRIGTVGPAIKFIEAKIAEDGEILVRGPQVMKGYYNLPKETAEVLEPDGWFHTGDIGELDPDGALRITDRKKDLIKTSGGKYIAPQELESALKTEPLISQVVIHGDRRKYVSALITLSEENARKWAEEHRVPAESFAELTRRPEIRARLQAAIDALNASQPSYATVKRFAILDHEWSQETGEITPSLKVKRKFVTSKFLSVLDGLYEGEAFD